MTAAMYVSADNARRGAVSTQSGRPLDHVTDLGTKEAAAKGSSTGPGRSCGETTRFVPG